MCRPFLSLAALFVVSSSLSFAGEPLPYELYMMPPDFLSRAALPEIAAHTPQPVVEPVEAPRPMAPVEVAITPVEEIFSCVISLPSESPLVAPAIEPQSEQVTVVFEPVVAPRPSL